MVSSLVTKMSYKSDKKLRLTPSPTVFLIHTEYDLILAIGENELGFMHIKLSKLRAYL
jgi:hypothetical protein